MIAFSGTPSAVRAIELAVTRVTLQMAIGSLQRLVTRAIPTPACAFATGASPVGRVITSGPLVALDDLNAVLFNVARVHGTILTVPHHGTDRAPAQTTVSAAVADVVPPGRPPSRRCQLRSSPGGLARPMVLRAVSLRGRVVA